MDSHQIDDRDKPCPDWELPPEPPIHRAARLGDLSKLQSLLNSRADLNVTADLEFDNGAHLTGLTTLMVAARSIDGASTATLRWLVEHGADIHARSDGGNTAAWYAAGHGGRWDFHKKAVTPDHVDRLRYLLDLGLDPTECNVGRSLITEACEAGDPARVQLLLDRGASATNLQARSLDARTKCCASMPSEGGREGAVAVPLGDADFFQIPLSCAARSGSAECVELILKAGADPNTRDSSGRTALMVSGSAAVVRTLLQAGADLHATDESGTDAFESIIEESCDAGACGLGRFEVAQALFEAGVDLERVDRYGKTRLASAAFGHHADAVEFLLKLGAKANAMDSEGETPLHSICWQGEYKDEQTNRDCEQIIRALVRAGADVNAVDKRGKTAMHHAAQGDWSNQTAIRTLIELGADPDPADKDGDTPLMHAAYSGSLACVQLLLQSGASPTRRNKAGRSALDVAREHLSAWENIVADGPDVSMAKRDKQLEEDLVKELGGAPGYATTDLSKLLSDQAKHQQSKLDEARRSLETISRAIEERGEST